MTDETLCAICGKRTPPSYDRIYMRNGPTGTGESLFVCRDHTRSEIEEYQEEYAPRADRPMTDETPRLSGFALDRAHDTVRITYCRPAYVERDGRRLKTMVVDREWELTGTELLDVLEGRA